MPLELIPGNEEIIAILTRQIDGPFRFVHHAIVPYVRVGPARDDVSIVIRPCQDLRLFSDTTRILRGREETMDFAVLFVGKEVVLADIGTVPEKKAVATRLLNALVGPE